MTTYKLRIAKPCDASQIADVHYHVRDRYTEGIFLSLGKSFLKKYYKIILNDPYEIIVCAEKDDGKIVGFSSCTLDMKSQLKSLKGHKFMLAFSALWAIIKQPSLFKSVWQRYRSIDNTNAPKFISNEGVRHEYWCWLPTEKAPETAIEVSQATDSILALLGAEFVEFEVDKFNKAVYKFHLLNGAKVIEEYTLPDGRERVLMRQKLQK